MNKNSHYNDPGIQYGRSREWGDASEEVKASVRKMITDQARKAGLSDYHVAGLHAHADFESGCNPDAANKNSDASGVFQIRDKTAEDAVNRLNGKWPSGGYEFDPNYDRFDPKSNIAFGIAIYLDKKRRAGSDNIRDIYKQYNPNATKQELDRIESLFNTYRSKISSEAGPNAPQAREPGVANTAPGNPAPEKQPEASSNRGAGSPASKSPTSADDEIWDATGDIDGGPGYLPKKILQDNLRRRDQRSANETGNRPFKMTANLAPGELFYDRSPELKQIPLAYTTDMRQQQQDPQSGPRILTYDNSPGMYEDDERKNRPRSKEPWLAGLTYPTLGEGNPNAG